MDVFECYETNEESGINNNEFTSIADAISAGTFDSTMAECLKPDTVEEKCKDIYDSSTTIGANSGSNGLAFLDFYQISCNNFWPYCSEVQAHQAFSASDIDNNQLLNE